MDLLILLWLVISVISTVILFFKKKYSYWKERGIEYVEPSFPLGNLSFGGNQLLDFIQNMYNHKQRGPLIGAYIIWNPVAVPTDLDLIQKILVKDFNSFHARGMYVNAEDDPLSANMFSLDGEKWKFIRSKLSPTFTSGKMKFMLPTVVDVAERFNEILGDIVKTQSVLEIKDLLARFTTDVIGSCAFGVECNSLKDPNAIFRYYGKKVIDEPHSSPLMQILAAHYPDLARKFHVRITAKDVEQFFIETVRKTVEYRERNNIRRNDFLDLLIQMNKDEDKNDGHSKKLEKLSLNVLAAQAFLFFLAGFETSSTTMMYSLYELALNSDIQNKARREINAVLANHDGKLSYEAMQEMIYIEQIINEALRKYPPVTFLIRKTARDYQLPHSKAVIEKGTEIFIPAYGVHHDPEIYPNPEIFDPERFSADEVKRRHPMSFLAFGDGPRNCVGLRFGKMQAKVGLIALIKNYQFAPCSKTSIRLTFDPLKAALTPKGGMFLDVQKVDRKII
ncbi:unnamed protein product [Hermetia illucens]|uniref:Cytochrome P450 n=1 Tax=Hermetia illucens TaxID=343691 RepID=A0A7R8UF05_HERIL|nr:cytochrome P450 6A1-like [Hermetia illucens]CAD7079497.1 unnamed protein product [Hermetia illucens]